jgi:hypothetical protein
MQGTIDLIQATLEAGMNDPSQPYYVKTWFIHDPLAVPQVDGPSAVIYIVQPNSRLSVFVGEDTVSETAAIRFYQPATRMYGESAETAPGLSRLTAQLEQAQVLLRADPTFGSEFVMTEIKSVDSHIVTGSETNPYRVGEIIFDVKLRKLWGS